MLKALSLFLVLLCVCGQDDKPGWNKDDTFCGPKSCYDIMGVSSTATKEEIKAQFRTLSREYHPDKNSSPEAQEKMQEINNANEVVYNVERRKQYDAMLKVRKAIDAPRENAFIVFFVLFLLVSFLVLQYKKQEYRNLKTQLVTNAKIKRRLSNQPEAQAVKKSKKTKRLRKPKTEEELDLTEFDDGEITKAIEESGLEVEGWYGKEPQLLDACMTVLQSPFTLTFALISTVWGLVMGGSDNKKED